ncbi:MAG: NAD+ synthase [Candidatus Heimdallarchaeota archaeon]
MDLDSSAFDIDCDAVSAKVEQFIKEYVEDSKTKGVVIGISGGIDSAVSVALAVRALGKEKVLGFILPNAALDPKYEKDARELAKQLDIEVKKISIAEMVEAFKGSVDKELLEDKLVVGNVMARSRMVLLYAYANHLNYLVLGTSNKTEILVGYVTKYGDGGADFEPCGDLYKTHICTLAKYLDIPEDIISKPPSAGLWDGQTDEGELGITYKLLDKVLLGFEKKYSHEKIAKELEIDISVVKKVEHMVKKSEHKRKTPPILEI